MFTEHSGLNWTNVTSQDIVVRSMLLRNAADLGDRTFITFEDESQWTFQDALEAACEAANALRALGVGRGDRIALLLQNGPEQLRASWGAAMLGVTVYPVNTAFIGSMLARPLRLCEPRLIVVSDEFRQRIEDLGDLGSMQVIDPEQLWGGERSVPTLDREIGLWENQLLIMTSGTTGPSKLAQISPLHPFAGWTSMLQREGFGVDDVFQIDLPLFHMAALGYVSACLFTHSQFYLRTRPAFDRYWELVRDHGITGACIVSSMVAMLMAKPQRPAEREHMLKHALISPLPENLAAFQERFRIPRVISAYGSTEVSSPIQTSDFEGKGPGYCGQLRDGWDMRLVDEHHQDVAPGTPGHALFRTARPLMSFSGYFGDQSANAAVWRHGWLHTGDLMRMEPNGDIYFVDREKDALRRRGEMISAFEVELSVADFAGVAEVACVAFPSDTGVEDDVKVWVVPKGGVVIDPAELLRHCVDTMPYYMVPRYFEFVNELPKTPSIKVQKYLLRERGNGPDTWDCAAHGLVVSRHGLTEQPRVEI